jgi:predicted nucleotidyltransferase
MSIRLPIQVPADKLAEFCRKWKITELSLFGSVVRDDFRPDSDDDVLVVFSPQTRYSLFDVGHMEEELKKILGRDVDLVEKRAIEHSDNYIRRKQILDSAVVVYAA